MGVSSAHMKTSEAVRGWVLAGLGMTLAVVSGCSGGSVGGGGACHDDSPPPSAMFYEGGSPCTLPDGRQGLGDGSFGCVDPTLCHCLPEAGPVTCATGAVCVYAACNGANPGAACALAGGGQGTCCNGACSAVDLLTDPANCGGCGFVCPEGVSCDHGACAVPSGTTSGCPSGTVLAVAACLSSACLACIPSSCAGLADGAACALPPVPDPGMNGLCCGGACVSPIDNDNCAGCGVTCCAGTMCRPGSPYFGGSSLGIVATCG